MDKISIIVPIYNAEDYLSECITSILKQTYKNIEVILINDGSSDSTRDICEKFSLTDNRVCVINKERNTGVSSSRNAGLDKATGKYIMFCDCDDCVAENWCEKMHQAINALDDCEIAVCCYNRVLVHKNSIKPLICTEEFIDANKFYLLTQYDMFNSVWNKIYLKSKIEDNHIRFDENTNVGEDCIFNLDYLKNYSGKISVCNDTLYNYMIRNKSLDNSYRADMYEVHKKIYGLVRKRLVELDVFDEFVEQYYHSYFKVFLKTFKNTLHKDNPQSIIKKIKQNNAIMQDKDFEYCIKYADKNIYSKLFLKIVSTKKYALLHIYKKLCKVKAFFKNKK